MVGRRMLELIPNKPPVAGDWNSDADPTDRFARLKEHASTQKQSGREPTE